ncbi:hypothetical protein ACLQ3J_09870 [Rhodococcus sp. DT1]
MLVREAAQNSWDARLGGEPVRFSVELNELRAGLAPVWRRLLEQNAPTAAQLPIRTSLSRSLRILSISDRGTRGLGGPTRADNAITDNNDFVSFVRNIGEPRNNDLGGGTYGFGKAVFYLLSRSGTVLIHTRCRTSDGYETRLIGCSLWKSYTVGEGLSGRRFTGRHWWGDITGDVVEPLVGAEAERVSTQLGLAQFGEFETGTTITIIDPDLDERSPEEATRWIADAITWNLWPKMVTKVEDDQPGMFFSVRLNGEEVGIPDPATTAPLRLFVEAYRRMDSPSAEEIWVKSPKIYLGRLGMYKTMAKPFEPSAVAEECGFKDSSHHICLMRTAELVVKYLKGAATGAQFISYAGVFRADSNVDDSYARAEPPTHDDWVVAQLEGKDRRIVNVTYSRLKEFASAQVETGESLVDATQKLPLGAASRRFSGLVAGAFGFGGVSATSGFSRANNNGGTGSSNSTPGDSVHGREGEGSVVQDGYGPAPATPPGSSASSNEESEPPAHEHHRGDAANPDAPVGRHRAKNKPSVLYLGEPFFDFFDGAPVVAQRFRVMTVTPVEIRGEVRVVIPGAKGREVEPPVNAQQPEIIGWYCEDGHYFSNDSIVVVEDDNRTWKVLVRPVPDTVTNIELRAEVTTA